MTSGTKVLMTGAGAMCARLSGALSSLGHATALVTLAELETKVLAPFEVVLLVGGDAIESCKRLTTHVASAGAIVVDETPHLSRAIAALRAGAVDYMSHLDDVAAVDAAIRRVVEERALLCHLGRLEAEVALSDAEPRFLGESEVFCDVRDRIDRLRSSDATVLITGESGTGKEVAARLLHATSSRCDGPFVAVNCGAIPAQLVESEFFGHARGAFTGAVAAKTGLLIQASGGTLFLDEVGAMPLPAQAKLLRAIQERAVRPLGQGNEIPFDARIIAATSVNLAEQVSAGRFRSDLFFRLNVVPIRMPPLRDRGPDTLLLAHHFLRRFADLAGRAVVGMTLGAARTLMSYDWPGNVRELSNWMEAAIAHTHHDHVTDGALRSNLRCPPRPTGFGVGDVPKARSEDPRPACWQDVEARHVAAVLDEVGGNKARAARLLGIDRKTLYRKLRRYGSPVED